MTLHHAYLTAMTALFIVVFALIIHSLITHRTASGSPSAQKFGGPTGRGQWLWALVPLAILGAVDFVLIEGPASSLSATPQASIESARSAAEAIR